MRWNVLIGNTIQVDNIGKGLALLIKKSTMDFNRFNLFAYNDWYYNTTFVLTMN